MIHPVSLFALAAGRCLPILVPAHLSFIFLLKGARALIKDIRTSAGNEMATCIRMRRQLYSVPTPLETLTRGDRDMCIKVVTVAGGR